MAYRRGDFPVQMRRFEEIALGEQAKLRHRLTEQDVEAFASLTGDYNPLHMDAEYARRTSLWAPVAHGMLSASFISTLIGTLLPGGGALWSSQKLEFLSPARIGDVLHVNASVRQKSEATRSLVLDVVITNEDGRKLVTGESVVKVVELQPATPRDKTGLTVLVTGGSRGIGAAVATKLASEGHAVVVNYARAADDAARVAARITEHGGRAVAARADVSQPQQVAGLVEAAEKEFGPIQALAHCAGLGSAMRPFEELDWTAIEQQLNVHVKGAFHCARAVLPGMVKAQEGSLVFLGSIAADGVPPALQSDYVIAKAALAALARSLAVEYGPKGVRVNVISPGLTITEMTANLPEKAKLLTRMQTPLRRLGEPDDVAEVVSFLLGPGGRHVTGENIRVCGGAVMR